MAWLKSHWSQVLVLVLSLVVGAGLHFGKITPDQATAFGALLALVGIHLPAVVYKVPPVVGAMLTAFMLFVVGVFALSLVMLACTKQQTAKTEYGAQVQACVDVSHTRDEFETCFHGVQIKWDDAGAPPALVFAKDGGAQ